MDVAQVTQALWQADPAYIVLALVLYMAAILTNTLKWGILLRAQGVEAPWSVLVRSTFVGLFFNNVLPAAVGGDVMRGYELTRYTRRGADAAVSIIVDRIIGLIALTGTAIVSVFYAQLLQAAEGTDLTNTFWVSVMATLALVGGFMLMISRRMRIWVGTLLEQLVQRITLLRPLVPLYNKLAESLGAYRHQPGVIFLALGIALFTWLFSNLVNYTLSLSLHPAANGLEPISLLTIFIFNPLIGLSQLIPASIGGLGLNQNLYDFFYHQLVDYNQTHVVAVSFLMQFVVYLTSLPGGIIWWFDRGQPASQKKAEKPVTTSTS